MSKIWLVILIASISTLLFVNPDAAITAMIAGSHSSVSLAINLVAVYAFWLGFFAILEKLGLSDKIAKLLRPLIRFLFKGAPTEAEKYITMNMSANLLGLGNASTPMGIKSINILAKDQKIATSNMIMMIVISATSLQLLPSTVIGMRASHGSVNPADFLLASTIATVLSTVIGIVLVKVLSKIFTDQRAEERAALKAKIRAEKAEKKGKTAEKIKRGKLKKRREAALTGSSLNRAAAIHGRRKGGTV